MSRLLGLDYGQQRIGVALSDEGRRLASPHSVFKHKGWGPSARAVQSLLLQTGADFVILGLPLSMDGSHSAQTREALGFKQRLEDLGIRVELQDERLSSLEAEEHLRQRGKSIRQAKALVDQEAAALILQTWLDENRVQSG